MTLPKKTGITEGSSGVTNTIRMSDHPAEQHERLRRLHARDDSLALCVHLDRLVRARVRVGQDLAHVGVGVHRHRLDLLVERRADVDEQVRREHAALEWLCPLGRRAGLISPLPLYGGVRT